LAYSLDSSAIVKRYVQEVGTAWVQAILDPDAKHRLYAARIASVEVVSAFVRRAKSGGMTAPNAARAVQQFRHEFPSLFRVIEITPSVIQDAINLVEKHALRGYDAVQLAAVLQVNVLQTSFGLPDIILISSDTGLNAAAQSEGLNVVDPNQFL
jgi:predicted nucleic acid-binding protein